MQVEVGQTSTGYSVSGSSFLFLSAQRPGWAQQRGYEIVDECTDRISGAKARPPGLDKMMLDDRRNRYDARCRHYCPDTANRPRKYSE